mmetsp:Transcript_80548/g.261024  ORF Transcript_80548/g.261024 Transcript_80548/m.261024 type:complete len:362 (+) Transcript_80548:118-1203(+)
MQAFLDPPSRGSAGSDGPTAPDGALRWVSAAMVATALLLFAYEGLAYNLIFLGRVLPAVGKGPLVAPLFVAFNCLWGLALWSFLQAHARDPGVVPGRWHEFVRATGQALTIVPARPEWQPGKATFCRLCARPRPDRAHHCRICGTCVLRMDHHCPWIGNCVGFGNHKFFLLLGLYADLACSAALASTAPELVACLAAAVSSEPRAAWRAQGLEALHAAAFLAAGALSLLLAALLSHMLAIHLQLAAGNATSIEDFYENMSNPFDQGSARANLEQIFGACGPDWLVPVKPLRPLSDGISFPRAGDGELAEPGDGKALPWGAWHLHYGVQPPEPGAPAAPGTAAPSDWSCGLGVPAWRSSCPS